MGVTDVSDEGRVRTIRLNRPDKKNALNGELAWWVGRFEIRNIMRAFDSSDADEARKAFFERRPPNFEGR